MANRFPRVTSCLLISLTVLVATALIVPASGQGRKLPAPTNPRAVPGIGGEDQFPRGCVDCHLNYADQKTDLRFSTLMKQWAVAVDPKLLKKVAGAAPSGIMLKGKHPAVLGALKNIPAACLPCHGGTAKAAPRLSSMMHAIHLTGGKENRFLTLFQGECTHCHKLNASTGTWSLPSGPEK